MKACWRRRGSMYERMHDWAKAHVYNLMGGETRKHKEIVKGCWGKLTLPDYPTREDIEKWAVDVGALRPKVYECGIYPRTPAGNYDQVLDLRSGS